jgi:hypothetical protein
MGTVGPGGDSIRRFIAMYRYGYARRELRDVVLAAFDDEQEFQNFLDLVQPPLHERDTEGR